jgi:hypothetical protein
MPLLMISLTVSLDSLAGPMVQTILVLGNAQSLLI